MVKDVYDKRGDLGVYEAREIRDTYCEFVVLGKDTDGWSALLSTELGMAVKPPGTKPSPADKDVTAGFGGVDKGQTLFRRDTAGKAIIAMFWPWNDGEHVTVKMAEVDAPGVEETPAVQTAKPGGGTTVKYVVIALAVVAVVFIAVASVAGCRYKKALAATTVELIDPATVADGVYDGYHDLVLVTARVDVKVAGGRIEGVSLRGHRHGPGYGADATAEQIVRTQSLDVDGVSGATGSTTAIRKAVEVALRKGVVERAPVDTAAPSDSAETQPAE